MMTKNWEYRFDRVYMFNSFYGLDKPVCLPPNFNLIGPIDKQPTALMEQLKKKDLELFNWLEDALQKKENVVYISLGSICKW